MLKQFYSRGLHMLMHPQQARALQQVDFTAIINSQQRSFAKKKKAKKDDGASMTEEEPVEEPVHTYHEPVAATTKLDFSAATKAQPAETVARELFSAFSVGDVKQVQSTPGNKPPSQEDTIEGRYASVLFSSASENQALYTIYEDISYIKSLYDNSESFKLFTQNAGVGAREIQLFN